MQCAGYLKNGRCPYNGEPIANVLLCPNHKAGLAEYFTVKPAPLGIVYYLIDSGLAVVKIGYTTILRKRIKAHRRINGGLLLAATEPGSFSTEHARHQQWKHLLIRGREWYRPTRELLEFTLQVRETYGILDTAERRTGRVPSEWIVQ